VLVKASVVQIATADQTAENKRIYKLTKAGFKNAGFFYDYIMYV